MATERPDQANPAAEPRSSHPAGAAAGNNQEPNPQRSSHHITQCAARAHESVCMCVCVGEKERQKKENGIKR